MKSIYTLIFFITTITFACTTKPKDPNSPSGRPGDLTALIKDPASNSDPISNIGLTKVRFPVWDFDHGEITEGDIVYYAYKFKNVGDAPLLISNAASSCGCTVPKWPDQPINPGESGEILVKFDSKDKPGKQSKVITVEANTEPRKTRLIVRAQVNPKL